MQKCRLLPIHHFGFGGPIWYGAQCDIQNNIIIAATNHMTTFFSLQTLYGGWRKTFVNKHATAASISLLSFVLDSMVRVHLTQITEIILVHTGHQTINRDKLRREIGNILCLKCKNAVKYTKRNSRCRSGNMTVDGLRITGVECQVADGN